MTGNDVIDFAKYYNGKDETPHFYMEYLDLKNKFFVPIDDVSLSKKLCKNTKKDAILHYFAKDTKQNRLIKNISADYTLHKKFYAVCSPDFSVDSNGCYACFNNSNILKSRICAYKWQSSLGLCVILTLIWGKEDTYKYAFQNIEKGSIVAISYLGVKEKLTFKKGFLYAINHIQPGYICWYGYVPNYVKEYYDINRLVNMQTRGKLITMQKKKSIDKMMNNFDFINTCA